jgi:hypothetical protein
MSRVITLEILQSNKNIITEILQNDKNSISSSNISLLAYKDQDLLKPEPRTLNLEITHEAQSAGERHKKG